MVKSSYYRAERFLVDVLKRHPISDSSMMEGIQEYIAVGELEIAFEGAFLWYVEHGTQLSSDDMQGVLLHGAALGIDKERSIDETAWDQFQKAYTV